MQKETIAIFGVNNFHEIRLKQIFDYLIFLLVKNNFVYNDQLIMNFELYNNVVSNYRLKIISVPKRLNASIHRDTRVH